MREMTLETFYIINQIPKIILKFRSKFRSLKISLEPLQRSFHREEKTEISRQASWDVWNSPLCPELKIDDGGSILKQGPVSRKDEGVG